jgi:UDP-N-acetylmuramoyl-L-alanyl-D-glutamate--2,6-diaminopimelate ligase
LADAVGHLRGARRVGPAALATGLTLASGEVLPGDLFVALPGARTHGARFARAALAAGAIGVLTDEAGAADIPLGVAGIVAPDLRSQLGGFAAWFYGYPARSLRLVGVTGTNGKTTVAHLLEAALGAAGAKVALLGTIVARCDGVTIPSARTTVEAPALQAALAAMVERGVEACALEVSSHALASHRVDGFVFDVAAFTNLGRDHLDFHGSMEAYFAAKTELFAPRHARRGVVFLGDAWARRLVAARGVIPLETVSADPADQPDWLVEVGRPEAVATPFALVGRDGTRLESKAGLPGRHNVDNAALALVSAHAAGIDPVAAARAIAAAAPPPGRMQAVPGPAGAPAVVVDYAHSPDSVAAALRALRPHTRGRLIAVLGAGGDRDQGKRAAMGAAARRWADVVIVTDDNPRSEDPARIRAAILAGAGAGAHEAPDRADAIVLALAMAAEGDTVVALGKGHETSIDYGGELRPHQDAAVAALALSRIREGGQ